MLSANPLGSIGRRTDAWARPTVAVRFSTERSVIRKSPRRRFSANALMTSLRPREPPLGDQRAKVSLRMDDPAELSVIGLVDRPDHPSYDMLGRDLRNEVASRFDDPGTRTLLRLCRPSKPFRPCTWPGWSDGGLHTEVRGHSTTEGKPRPVGSNE